MRTSTCSDMPLHRLCPLACASSRMPIDRDAQPSTFRSYDRSRQWLILHTNPGLSCHLRPYSPRIICPCALYFSSKFPAPPAVIPGAISSHAARSKTNYSYDYNYNYIEKKPSTKTTERVHKRIPNLCAFYFDISRLVPFDTFGTPGRRIFL